MADISNLSDVEELILRKITEDGTDPEEAAEEIFRSSLWNLYNQSEKAEQQAQVEQAADEIANE